MQKSAVVKERLVFRRNRLGLTQEDLAEKSGVSLRSISNYEKGDLPTLEQLFKLAQALQVEPGYFLGDEIKEMIEMHDRGHPGAAGVYSHLETGTLMKSLAELSGKVAKVADHERKYLLGNIRAILDELEDRELRHSPQKVTTVTKHGIVREEHADLRGVSSEIAERVKAGAAGAAAAAGLTGRAGRPTSPKAASTSGSKAEPSDPADQRSGPGKVAPKTAPK